MLKEISTAVNFLSQLMRRSRASSEQLQTFREKLTMLLAKKYLAHWDTALPLKGNAYRAISNLHKPDPLIQQAASESGLSHFTIPKDFVMWIDPGNVSYRFGDRGCIFCLYDSRPGSMHNPGAASMHMNGNATPNGLNGGMNGVGMNGGLNGMNGMNGILGTPTISGMSMALSGMTPQTTPNGVNGVNGAPNGMNGISGNGGNSNLSTPQHTATTPSGIYSRSASIGSPAHGSPSSTSNGGMGMHYMSDLDGMVPMGLPMASSLNGINGMNGMNGGMNGGSMSSGGGSSMPGHIFGTSPSASPNRSKRIEVVHPATHAARKEAQAREERARQEGTPTPAPRGKEILVG